MMNPSIKHHVLAHPVVEVQLQHHDKQHLLLLGIVSVFFILAVISPVNYLTLFFETLPIIVGVGILIYTYKNFRLTTLVYGLLTIECIVALFGAHYGYVHTPGFEWLKEVGVFSRNNFDKLGHVVLGFAPAILIREILLRKTRIRRTWLLPTTVLSMVLAIAASYEIIEYTAAVFFGSAADDFLGTQGFMWDTQTDILYTLIGGVAAVVLLSKVHDRALLEVQ